jgi:hypothetical protein
MNKYVVIYPGKYGQSGKMAAGASTNDLITNNNPQNEALPGDDNHLMLL